MRLRLRLVLLAALGAALLAPGEAAAQNVRLNATVGPGFTIQLRTEAGAAVTQLDPGTYEIHVEDLSEEHNFHLQGPGVNESTSLPFVGSVTWTVTFAEGRYTFVCDPHASVMRGSFTAGDPPPPPPPPAPPPVTRLVATVGPQATITLRDARGRRVHHLAVGRYRIVVRDRSRVHNVHLLGAGIDRKTGKLARRTYTWNVRLRRGTLRYFSDASPKKLRGSVRVG
jgi:plastocyanin